MRALRSASDDGCVDAPSEREKVASSSKFRVLAACYRLRLSCAEPPPPLNEALSLLALIVIRIVPLTPYSELWKSPAN